MRIVFCALATLSILGACNTIQGVGNDITDAGNALERTVK